MSEEKKYSTQEMLDHLESGVAHIKQIQLLALGFKVLELTSKDMTDEERGQFAFLRKRFLRDVVELRVECEKIFAIKEGPCPPEAARS